TAYVAGQTAAGIDVSAKLSGALPHFIAIIVVLALRLLMIAFRSVLVPLKAVLGVLLSIAASLGAVVWVFQYGHHDGIFQVAAAAPIV
ncbi:MMPL family transporter, partial [Streptomyces sp. DT18]